MKKAILLAVCLALAGTLTVNGTLADDLNRLLTGFFKTVNELVNPAPKADRDAFKINIVYTDAQGTPLASQAEAPMLSPGDQVDRYTAVANESGEKSAYVRIAMAVQEEAAGLITLTLNMKDYTWSDWMDITIDGADYRMIVATWPQALAPGAQASAFLQSVAMDTAATSAQINALRSDFLQIKAVAIDTAEFTAPNYPSAQAALDAAAPIDENNHPF